MIEEFFASWELFQNSYLSGWLIAVVLSLLGVFVVARDQIFFGAAVAQSSTLGIAIALAIATWLSEETFSWLHSATFPAVMAVLFSIIASVITARGDRSSRESHEAITGWVFLLAASLSVLIVSHSPHGLEEIHKLLFSSIIGATPVDVVVFGTLSVLLVLCVIVSRQRLLLFMMDPPMARAVGMNTARWTIATYLVFGLAVGLSIRVSGLLYTFGSLVLPPLIAKNLAREVFPMFVIAPLVALATAVVGFVLAHGYDFPPAQMTVALMSGGLAVAWGGRWVRGRRSEV